MCNMYQMKRTCSVNTRLVLTTIKKYIHPVFYLKYLVVLWIF